MPGSSSKADDTLADPFAIHHSDSPTMVLVSPQLSGDNYGSWLHTITMALRGKNKFGFVDGSLTAPTTPDDLVNWQRCNDLVGSWFLNSITPDIRSNLMYSTTARAIWLDLSECFF